ncbi:MAG: ankyrin repeat domain-containing protein [Legionella sp.]|nr:ankyrin repeat domain-containing protein [Legionella sp.]
MTFKQATLIDNIRLYLLNRDRNEAAAKLSPGYCFGISLLFCYFARNKKFEAFKKLIQNAESWTEDLQKAEQIERIKTSSKWQQINNKLTEFLEKNSQFYNQSVITQLNELKVSGEINQEELTYFALAMLPDDVMIEKLLGLINTLQQPNSYSYLQTSSAELINLISKQGEAKEHHSIQRVGIIAKPDLAKILNEFPHDNAAIIGNGRHAVAVYRDEHGFRFCESNYGVSFFSTSGELAQYLLQTTFIEIIGFEIPFTIDIIDSTHPHEDFIKLFEECANKKNTLPILSQDSLYPHTGVTPLHLAAIAGFADEIERIVKETPLEELHKEDGMGFYPIHYAPNTKIIELLLSNHANIEAQIYCPIKYRSFNDEGEYLYQTLEGATPFYQACASGNLELAQYLYQKDANINAVNRIGLTPLAIAVIKKQTHVVDWLLQQKEINRDFDISSTPQARVFEKSRSPLEYFGGVRDIDQYYFLNLSLIAAKNNDFKTYFTLIRHGFDLNFCNKNGLTALQFATLHQNTEAMQLLLAEGADVDALCPMSPGDTTLISPLWLACNNNNLPTVQLLLEAGAQINPSNAQEEPCIIAAVNKDLIYILEELVKKNVNLSTKWHGETPLAIAIKSESWQSAQYLLMHYSDWANDESVRSAIRNSVKLALPVLSQVFHWNVHNPEREIQVPDDCFLDPESRLIKECYSTIGSEIHLNELLINMLKKFNSIQAIDNSMTFFGSNQPSNRTIKIITVLENNLTSEELCKIFIEDGVIDAGPNLTKEDQFISSLSLFINDVINSHSQKYTQPLAP